jgi:hypothetical protein
MRFSGKFTHVKCYARKEILGNILLSFIFCLLGSREYSLVTNLTKSTLWWEKHKENYFMGMHGKESKGQVNFFWVWNKFILLIKIRYTPSNPFQMHRRADLKKKCIDGLSRATMGSWQATIVLSLSGPAVDPPHRCLLPPRLPRLVAQANKFGDGGGRRWGAGGDLRAGAPIISFLSSQGPLLLPLP